MTDLIQGTQEWLEFRKDKIGASDAPVVMGVSPYQTPLGLWEEKLGLRPQRPFNPGMKRGQDLEEEARVSYQTLTGNLMRQDIKMHPKLSFMIASLDGIDIDEKMIVEIKCPSREEHEQAKKGNIPEKYLPQLQHQLEVTGLDGMHYFSYYQGDGALIEVERENSFIKELLQKEREFYNFLKDFECPPMSDKDFAQRNDQEWIEAAQSYLDVSTQLKDLEMRKESLRTFLIQLSDKRNTKGGGIRVSRSLRKGAIDMEKLLKDFDISMDAAEKYRKKTVETWRIT